MDEVVIAILVKNKEGILREYLDAIQNQTYPKNKIHIYIRTNDNTDKSEEILQKFKNENECEYASIYMNAENIDSTLSKYGSHEWNSHRFKILGKIRQESVDYAISKNAHYFVVDCDNFITSTTLTDMFNIKDIGVVAPKLENGSTCDPNNAYSNNAYSNYFCDIDQNGYYKSHENYYKILNREIKGIFEVPVIHCTYFIANKFLKKVCYDDNSNRYEYAIFCDVLRKNKIPQFIDNRRYYGFLTFDEKVDKDYFNTRILGNPIVETYTTNYGKVTLYKNEKYIGEVFKKGEYWDESTLLQLRQYINPNRNILEIGGHCGTSSIIYSSYLNNDKKLFVYEPQYEMYKLLLQNVNQNNLRNKIIPNNLGVFCYEGEGTMNNIDLDGGGGIVKDRYTIESNLDCNFGGIGLGKDGEPIKMTTIDSMKIDDIGFIHCDAQGSEQFIFSKGIETITKDRPVIYYENNKDYGKYLYDTVCKAYPDYKSESLFDIKEYCMKILKYSKCIDRFNGGIDTLLIP